MTSISEPKTSVQPGTPDIEAPPAVQPNVLVGAYLLKHLQAYRDLCEVKREGWDTEEGDAYFQKQRERADTANTKTKKAFFRLMRTIGLELDTATSGLSIRRAYKPRHAILDLCMAPGGFSMAALHRNPSALLRGISLPPTQGGHEMLLRKWSDTDMDARIFVDFRDITMLADEMGVPGSSIPLEHPDAASFSSDRPFAGQKFDLVFCDGQVLRTHERGEHREKQESTRLITSQLVLALQRIRSGGAMVVLLHRADIWLSVKLIHMFTRFADSVELFKPLSGHKLRSSFYMVAKSVRPGRDAAVRAVEEWKAQWKEATFGTVSDDSDGKGEEFAGGEEEKVKAVLEEFGDALVRMTGPIFATQAEALRNAPWVKSGRTLTSTSEVQGDDQESLL